MIYTPEKFGQTIKTKYPEYKDIPDRDLGLKMLQKYPEYKDVVVDNTGAKDFINQKGPSTSLGKNFLKALPGAAVQVGVGGPAKFVASIGEGIGTSLKTGGKANYSGKSYDLPGIAPFKSFQSEAVDRAKEGQNPLLNIAPKVELI
jgi:hypothetical protein